MDDLFDQWRREASQFNDAAILRDLLAQIEMPECPVLAQLGVVVPDLHVEHDGGGNVSHAYTEWGTLNMPERFLL
jgi:hypothetical protein